MSIHALSITDALRDHRRNELKRENHEASLVRPANYKAPEPPYPIDESIFSDEGCPCGYQEGRSEADRRLHLEECVK